MCPTHGNSLSQWLGSIGLLVWWGIILSSRTNLRVQIIKLISQIYQNIILERNVRLFRGAMDAESVFMADNFRPHYANIINVCLQSERIVRRNPVWNSQHSHLT